MSSAVLHVDLQSPAPLPTQRLRPGAPAASTAAVAAPPAGPIALDSDARWALVLPHRERLLTLARRRCASLQDAEDCVQDAMIRVVRFLELDPDRTGPLLTTVVVRMCVDLHRSHQLQQRAVHRLAARQAALYPSHEDAVCDLDVARVASRMLQALPSREREILAARARGATLLEAATTLGISYKAANSAYARARARLQSALELD
jgi:RNA polymerase sigma factor (sigma-70 family)